MSVAVWPSELPRPTRKGYSAADQDGRLQRNAETGPPGYRGRFSSVARMVSLSVIVSRSEKGVFDRFWSDSIQRGKRAFWMPDPVSDRWPLLAEDSRSLLAEDDTPLLVSAHWLCVMQEPPQEQIYAQVHFEISFRVAVMP